MNCVYLYDKLSNNGYMKIYESVGNKRLEDLLDEVHTGEAVLPEFQRNFVWKPTATQGLLVSILNKFPAGVILRSRDEKRHFQTRPFENVKPKVRLHTFLVLDGQQRLTSLHSALFGVGAHRYFVDLKLVNANMEFVIDDAIMFGSSTSKQIIKIESDIGEQASTRFIPLSVFFKRAGGFHSWIFEARDTLPQEQRGAFEIEMHAAYDKFLCNFDEYEFPVATLDKEVPPESLCIIFETLNKSGKPLTIVEILNARFFRFGVNLKEEWEKALTKYPIIGKYLEDPYPILQAISLKLHNSCQRKEILGLDKKQLEDNWPTMVKALAQGLSILTDDCKIVNRKWLPTPSILGPLTAIMEVDIANKGPAAGAKREKVRRWLWCAIFSRRYEAAANTRGEADYRDVKKWILEGDVPSLITNFRFDRADLRETKPSSPIYKGVICMVLGSKNGALDFHNQSKISSTMVEGSQVDDHHIFPKAYLKNELGIEDSTIRNCVLNRTLIDPVTNIKISDKAPSTYLAELDPHMDTDKVLKSHLIPVGNNSPLRKDDFTEFLKARAELIYSEIMKVTGTAVMGESKP